MEAIKWLKKSIYKNRFSTYESTRFFVKLRKMHEESGDGS
jgi:hypothetical protein